MSGSKNKEFLADPLAFLASNLVVVNVQQVIRTGGVTGGGLAAVGPKFNEGAILTLDIRKTDRFYAQNSAGRTIDACELVEATGDAERKFGASHRFSAYYLPFFNNATRTMELEPPNDGETGPLYYVTDTMNGCAFAADDGLMPAVGHFNYTVGGAADAPIDDGEITRQINATFNFGTFKELRKAAYKRDAGDAITLIGVRGEHQWSYHWQRYSLVSWRDKKQVFQIDAAVHTI